MRLFPPVLVSLLTASVATVLCALIYVAVQQSYRMTANDPQVQMAEDAAARLAAGTPPAQVVPVGRIDITGSIAPYLIVYDDRSRPRASSATLDGQIPVLPAGVYMAARAQSETRITWQRRPGLRSAVVIVHYGGTHPGFVLAGRSLRETEQRVDSLSKMVLIGWMVSLALCFGAVLLLSGQRREPTPTG